MIRAMLLDDHPVVRAGLRAIIDSFGDVEVVAEGSNGKGVESASLDDVDVLITDVQMPDVDGITVTRRVVAAGGPPVLVLTTYDSEADIIAALEAGALGYLLKDAPEDQLHQAIVATAKGGGGPFLLRLPPSWRRGWAGLTWRCRRARSRFCERWSQGRRTGRSLRDCLFPRRR